MLGTRIGPFVAKCSTVTLWEIKYKFADLVLKSFDLLYLSLKFVRRKHSKVVEVLLRKVKDEFPLVNLGIKLGGSSMFPEAWIPNIEWREGEGCRGFNHGVVRRMQEDSTVSQVSTAELLTGDVDGAILAIAHKDGACNWPHHDH